MTNVTIIGAGSEKKVFFVVFAGSDGVRNISVIFT